MANEIEPKQQVRVLIADDEPDCRNLVEIALGDQGFELTTCDNGEEAIASCSNQWPDLAILDIQMPNASGIDVCQWMKAQSGKSFTPVILLTSRSEIADKVSGLDCGADEYVTKPFSLPELEARVRALLRIKTLADELRRTQDLLEEKEKQLVATAVAGGAAHELGQPLTTMLLNCALLQRIDRARPEFQQAVNEILDQAKRMKEILASLNKLQSYKTSQYPGNLTIIDLGITPAPPITK